jgi:uncharacterized membrane protein YdjX (TVP38/TMEM64 family)
MSKSEPVGEDGAGRAGGLAVRRVALTIVVVVAVVLLVRMLPTAEWLTALQSYVRGLGPVGWIVYALVYALCCVLFVPGLLLTVGAGAIFGVVEGAIVVVFGATLGALASFQLARTLMRDRITAMTAGNAKLAALDRAIAREGAKIVLLVRLAPVFPFTYINYAFGLTGVRALPYTVATFFGIMPATLAFVYLGSAGASAAAGTASTLKLVVNVAGALLAILATVFVARVALKAIRRAGVDDEDAVLHDEVGAPEGDSGSRS